MRSMTIRRGASLFGLGVLLATLLGAAAVAGEPDSKMYWDVKDLRPGMKGVGRTVMRGLAEGLAAAVAVAEFFR